MGHFIVTTTGKPTSDEGEDDITATEAVEDAEIVEETPPDFLDEIEDDGPDEGDEPVDEEVSEISEEPYPPEPEDIPMDEPEMEAPTATPPPPMPVEVPRIKRGPGFFTMLIGGLIAGAVGYVLAYATEFQPLPDLFGRPDPVEQIQGVKASLTEQAGRVDAVEESAGSANAAAAAAAEQASAAAQAAADAASQASTVADGLGALKAQVTELTPGEQDIPPALLDALRSAALDKVNALSERVAAAEAQVGAVQQQVEAVAGQIEALGGVQAGSTGEQLTAYEQQLAALQSDLDAQRDAIAAAQVRAEEMNAAATAQQHAVLAEAALARVRAAVTGGGVFAGPLAELQAATGTEIAAALTAVADTGVKSLPQLQDSFPAAARAGLDAAITAEAGRGTAMERLGSFLRAQSGARSLSEREGDDPDAVLSRAEARLSDGDVAAVLDEIAGLNEAGQVAMLDWIADAQARVDAQAAVDDLASTLAAE